MPDDWRKYWRSWLDARTYAHPDSPAGGSGTGFSRIPGPTGYFWSPLPDPNSPAGRSIHLQREIWALERRELDELARHIEELETSLAKQSDGLRASIPDGYVRTLYDRQVGRTKGAYGFAKSLIGTGVDAALLLQKLTSPAGFVDPDLQRKVQQSYSVTLAISKSYMVWKFGTLQEKKQLLQHVTNVAEGVFDEAKKSIQQQWAEAKRTGKQEELIERWKTRLLLEIGTLAIGAGELDGASAAAKEVRAADVLEDARLVKPPARLPVAESLRAEAPAAKKAVADSKIAPKKVLTEAEKETAATGTRPPYPGRRTVAVPTKPAELPNSEMITGSRKASAGIPKAFQDSEGVWDQARLNRPLKPGEPSLKQALKDFEDGKRGGSVKTYDPTGKSPEEIHHELLDRGFSHKREPLSTTQNGQKFYKKLNGDLTSDPANQDVVVQDLYTHPDGGMIRVKPEGDPGSFHRPEPHVSKSVLYDSSKGTEWPNEAFKVTNDGHAVPKAPSAEHGMRQSAPGSRSSHENQGFIDTVMNEGHTDLP